MITALSKDGKSKREVVYNDAILMVDKYDSLSFYVKNEKFEIDMKVNFDFHDGGAEFSATGTLSDDFSNLSISLNNWYSSSRAENSKPLEIKLKSGQNIWIKYGTSAIEKKVFRMFHLTIWAEIKL